MWNIVCNLSIRNKLILSVAFVHALLMGIFVFDLSRQQSSFLYNQHINRALGLSEMLSANTTPWVLASNLTGLNEIMLTLRNYPELKYSMILTAEGRVIAHTNQELVGKYVDDEISKGLLLSEAKTKIIVSSKNIVDVASPVCVNKKIVGWARIALGTEVSREHLFSIITNGILYVFLAIVLGTIAAFFLSRGLTGGLYKILHIAQLVKDGKISERVDIRGKDELGVLAETFNLMLNKIENNQNELEAAVDARTNSLKETLAFTEAIISTSPFGIFVFEGAGSCIVANNSGLEIIGATREQALAQNFHHISSWKKSGLYDLAINALSQKKTQRQICDMVSTFGKKATLACSASSFGGEEQQQNLLLMFTDVTELKEIETMLKKKSRDLERSNRDLEQFAYVASHDLRAPLRAIESLSEWLEQDLGDSLQAENAKHFQLLRSRAKRMETLLDDLLEYARANHFEMATENVDTAALIREIVDFLGLTDRFELKLGSLPEFTTARTPFRQVLCNLIGNVAKHHDKAKGHIAVTALERDGYYEFSVVDDGPGIPAQFRDRVFGMFQTLRPRDEVEGSGIGLAIVKKVIESLGGAITLCAVQPRGLEVRFTWAIHMTKEIGENAL
ncbi:MAG: ATP-binding protein [Candidatus Ozemobacteraceae bacterium]